LKGGDFCSDAHRQAYYEDQQKLVLERLIETEKILNRAKAARLATKQGYGEVSVVPIHGQNAAAGPAAPAAPVHPELTSAAIPPAGQFVVPGMHAPAAGEACVAPVMAAPLEPVRKLVVYPEHSVTVVEETASLALSVRPVEADPAVADLMNLALKPEDLAPSHPVIPLAGFGTTTAAFPRFGPALTDLDEVAALTLPVRPLDADPDVTDLVNLALKLEDLTQSHRVSPLAGFGATAALPRFGPAPSYTPRLGELVADSVLTHASDDRLLHRTAERMEFRAHPVLPAVAAAAEAAPTLAAGSCVPISIHGLADRPFVAAATASAMEPFPRRTSIPGSQPSPLAGIAGLPPAAAGRMPFTPRPSGSSAHPRIFGSVHRGSPAVIPAGRYEVTEAAASERQPAAGPDPSNAELAAAVPAAFTPEARSRSSEAGSDGNGFSNAVPEPPRAMQVCPVIPGCPRAAGPEVAAQVAHSTWKPEPNKPSWEGRHRSASPIDPPLAAISPESNLSPEPLTQTNVSKAVSDPPLQGQVSSSNSLASAAPVDSVPGKAAAMPLPRLMEPTAPSLPRTAFNASFEPRQADRQMNRAVSVPSPIGSTEDRRPNHSAAPVPGRISFRAPESRLDLDRVGPVAFCADIPRRTAADLPAPTATPDLTQPVPRLKTYTRFRPNVVGEWLRRPAVLATIGAVALFAAGRWAFAGGDGNTGSPTSESFQGARARLASRAAIKLTEKFQKRFDQWRGRTDLEKTWSVDEQGLIVPGDLAIYEPSSRMSDYTMTFVGKVEKKAMSWAFRIKDFQNYQAAKLVISKPGPLPSFTLERYAVLGGKEAPHRTIPISLTVRGQSMFEVKVEAAGPDIVVKIEDKIVDAWTDVRIVSGGVGFFSAKGESSRITWVDVEHQYDLIGRFCALFAKPPQISEDARDGSRRTNDPL
jgi:hypothetical protein